MRRLSLIRTWQRLRRDERGVAFVEFAFLAPILAVFVLAISDLSRGIAQQMAMQSAVNRSLELLLVRAPTASATDTAIDYSTIRQEAATAAGVTLAQTTMSQYLMCDGTRAAAYDSTCTTGQDTARYVSITVNKNFVGNLYTGTIALSATASMRVQ
jgi:Flp pilus assembly protein TadG